MESFADRMRETKRAQDAEERAWALRDAEQRRKREQIAEQITHAGRALARELSRKDVAPDVRIQTQNRRVSRGLFKTKVTVSSDTAAEGWGFLQELRESQDNDTYPPNRSFTASGYLLRRDGTVCYYNLSDHGGTFTQEGDLLTLEYHSDWGDYVLNGPVDLLGGLDSKVNILNGLVQLALDRSVGPSVFEQPAP